MEKNINLSGEDILNEDLVSSPDTDFNVPGYFKILFSLIMSCILLVCGILIHCKYVSPLISTNNYDLVKVFKYKLFLSCLLYLSIYMFLDFIILTMTKGIFTRDYRLDLTSLVLYKKSTTIKICLSLFIYCLLLNWYEYVIVTEEILDVIEETEKTEETVKMSNSQYIIKKFSLIVLAISSALAIYLIKSLFMCVMELRMFFSHYKERIEINEENTRVMDILNRSTGLKMFPNLQTWGHYVFNTISPDNDVLTFSQCENVFGTLQTKRIFRLFDTNNDLTITAGEFVSVYYGVIREKYFLNKSLLQKNGLFEKLNIIISILCFPLGVFISISILGYAKHFSNLLSVISGVILSMSFIFSSVVGELFRSLIFIFLVRPFEAGDYLRIKGKIYIVEELGLLYSSYLVDSLITFVQNTQIMTENIVNYRLSDVEEKRYKYTFNIKSFKEKSTVLSKRIKKIILKNTQVYLGKYDIANYEMVDEEKMIVEILIYFKINFQYIKGLTHNEDEFSLILDNIFKEIGLKVY